MIENWAYSVCDNGINYEVYVRKFPDNGTAGRHYFVYRLRPGQNISKTDLPSNVVPINIAKEKQTLESIEKPSELELLAQAGGNRAWK